MQDDTLWKTMRQFFTKLKVHDKPQHWHWQLYEVQKQANLIYGDRSEQWFSFGGKVVGGQKGAFWDTEHEPYTYDLWTLLYISHS